MDKTTNQMGLFETEKEVKSTKNPEIKKDGDNINQTLPRGTDVRTSDNVAIKVKNKKKKALGGKSTVEMKPATKPVSGLVPAGDVRLTANIRQDLHLRLKIAAAHRRTTIGEIIEELVAKHI